MATQKLRFLDIWLVDSNTVYKEVPFAVAADWLQQGRLLEVDRVKNSGTADWIKLADYPDLHPYLLRPEPMPRAEDQAEAMEPVDFEFQYAKRHSDDDDEVDMIPLIDVSLVLLVVFMLQAGAAGAAASVQTPDTEFGMMRENPEGMRIDIAVDDKTGVVEYSLGVGDKPAEPDEANLTSATAVLDRLKARLTRMNGPTELLINADKKLKAKVPRDMLILLRNEPFRSRLTVNYYGVSEKTDQ